MRIDDLETNLARTPIVARKLKAECQAFKKVIDDAVDALNKPKEVDDKLKSLSSDLGALYSGLTVAKVVRPIRLVAGRLQTSVKSVKRSVDKAEAKAKALEEKAKPIREKLKALSKQVGQFVKELDKLITQSTAALEKIKKVHGCVNSLQNPLRQLGLAQRTAAQDLGIRTQVLTFWRVNPDLIVTVLYAIFQLFVAGPKRQTNPGPHCPVGDALHSARHLRAIEIRIVP